MALNDALEKARPERLALPTCGASNGQTIVGATQTGTHGSAHAYGPMPNYVRALHIVAEGGKHYLIARLLPSHRTSRTTWELSSARMTSSSRQRSSDSARSD